MLTEQKKKKKKKVIDKMHEFYSNYCMLWNNINIILNGDCAS